MIIQHNIGAMNANRQLSIVSNTKAKSMEKLSSGYRINRAADDAAGLSISEKMRKQIRGLQRGVANVEDGVSLCQVADGALAEVTEMLQRINELSVQAANGTNSTSDRESIQKEIDQIKLEVDRISDTTSFNEIKLFSDQSDSIHNNTIGNSGVNIHENYAEEIQKTIKISANGNNSSSAGNHTITLLNDGIDIDGNSVLFSNIRNNNGNSLNVNNIEEGTYSINNGDFSLSFYMPSGAKLSHLNEALNNLSFDIVHKNYNVTYNATLSLEKANDSDNFLLSSTHSLHADENGMWVNNYNKVSWSSMGVNDSNIVGKTIEFKDNQSGVSLKIRCNDPNSDLHSLIYSINNGSLDIVKDLPRRVVCVGWDYTVGKVKVNVGGNYFRFGEQLVDDMGLSESDKISANMQYNIVGTSLNDLHCVVEGGGKTLTIGPKSPTAIAYYMNEIRTGGWTSIEYRYGTDSIMPIYVQVGPADRATVTETEIFDAIKEINDKIPLSCNLNAYRDSKFTIAPANFDDNIIDNVVFNVIKKQENKDESDQENEDETTVQNIPTTHIWIQAGAESHDGMYIDIGRMNAKILGIDKINVTSQKGADRAMDIISIALQKISTNRSRIGAQQNRLEHTIRNEDNVIENLSASESKIRDTDMADEVVRLSNLNIVEQAGQGILTQANQNNEMVLKLLQ